MKLVNTDNQLLKKYYDMDQRVLVLNLVPYKNNTCIKAYTENGEPIGDIEEEYISQYLYEKSVVTYIEQILNDETGLFEFVIKSYI